MGNEVIKGVVTGGPGSGLGIARRGGGVVPMRAGAEASLESGARFDSLRPLESVEGLMKIELERKVGWCWKGEDSFSKPYWAASGSFAASKTYPKGEDVLKSDVADCGCVWRVGVLLVSDSGDIGPARDTGVPS